MIKYIDLVFSSPAEMLACDEILLDLLENGGTDTEVLRTWVTQDYFIVLGCSGKAARDIRPVPHVPGQVPAYRRISGGGTVLQGPGCLNYTLVLRIPSCGPLNSISGTHRYVLGRHRDMFRDLLGEDVTCNGDSDLTWRGRKFSGNAQRRKRNYVLYHGTFLLDFDIERIESHLTLPERRPAYRQDRTHRDFLTNLPLTLEAVTKALISCWNAYDPFRDFPRDAVTELARRRYARETLYSTRH